MKSPIVGLAFTTLLAITAAQETMATVPNKNSIDKPNTAAAEHVARSPSLKGSRRKLEVPLSGPDPTPLPFSVDYDYYFDDDFSLSYTF